jgi:dGTPase
LTVESIDEALKALFNEVFECEPTESYGISGEIYRQSSVLAENGYFRTDLTSKLVNLFMSGIMLDYNNDFPCLSFVKFDSDTFVMVETLKKYAFKSLIMSPRLKIAERRGTEIIETIFDTILETDDGRSLLPDDWRLLYYGRPSPDWRYRTVCDFIASMTDRYCVEFYARLIGIDAPSIHRPFS